MRAEEGFTLIETLVTVVITGIISGAVAASVIIGLRTTDATANRLADSRDAQLAAAYFGTDVQAADEVNIPGSPPSCQSTVSSSSILELVDRPSGGGQPLSVVSYFTESTPEGTRDLRRVACRGGSVIGDVVVAADLGEGSPVAACAPSSCAQRPTQVKMAVSVRGCSATESTCREGIDSSPYQYELVGTTRSNPRSTTTVTAP